MVLWNGNRHFPHPDKEGDRDGNATVTIQGSTNDINDAKEEILNLASSSGRFGGGGGGNGGGGSRNHDSRDSRDYGSQSSDHKETMEIYPDKVGSVIGRRGITINELQEKFKVRVNIDKNANYNGKSTVSVSGSRNDVTSAIENIKELVGEPKTSDTAQSNPEPMEFEMIDWQAAARESVSKLMIFWKKKTKNIIMKTSNTSLLIGRRKPQALGKIATIAKMLLWRASRRNKHVGGENQRHSWAEQ